MNCRGALTLSVLAMGFCCAGALAQPQPRDQPDEQPAAPAGDPVQATVIEVRGSVMKAPAGVDPSGADGWQAVAEDDLLGGGMQIKTGFRAHATLRFGDNTVVSVRKMSNASIDDFYRSATEETINIGLGYGTIRAGSIEGDLRTEMTIDSTVATLAKRGTEGIECTVEPTTNRFFVSLSRSGLMEVLSKVSGDRKTVRAGEYANQANIMKLWVNQAVFDRHVQFFEDASVSQEELDFTSANPGGFAVVNPSASNESFTVSSQGMTQPTMGGGMQPPPAPTVVNRPEGDFGFPNTFGNLLDFGARRAYRVPASARGVERHKGRSR